MDEVIKQVRDAEQALRDASALLGKAEGSLRTASDEDARNRIRMLRHEAFDVALRVDGEAGMLEHRRDTTGS